MKYIKVFEKLDQSIYEKVQEMIDNNQFLKGKVEANENTVFEAGDFILLLGDLTHITDAHVDEKIPGSKFEKGINIKKAIINIISNNKPNEMSKGMDKVNDPKQADKFKQLGLDTKINVGIENVHKLKPDSEEFKSLKNYTYKDFRGNEIKIKVKEGNGEKTTYLSFIGGKIGEIDGKYVLSVITAFPGKNGSEIPNRNDFVEHGYYFTTTSKEVLDSLLESKKLKYIKIFEQFVNENENVTIKNNEVILNNKDQDFYLVGLADIENGKVVKFHDEFGREDIISFSEPSFIDISQFFSAFGVRCSYEPQTTEGFYDISGQINVNVDQLNNAIDKGKVEFIVTGKNEDDDSCYNISAKPGKSF